MWGIGLISLPLEGKGDRRTAVDEVVRDALIGYSRSAEHLISHGLRRASFPSRGSHATFGGYWMFTLSFETADRFGECHIHRFVNVF